MKSVFTFNTKEEYVFIHVTGVYSFRDMIDLPRQIKQFCKQENKEKVLVDCLQLEDSNTPSIDRYLIGVEAAKELDYLIQIALIWRKEFTTKFGENVAVNRGVHVKVFNSKEDGLDWLINQ